MVPFKRSVFSFSTAILLSTTCIAYADPDPGFNVFCFRIMDIERFGTGDNNFTLSFEVLNWSDMPAWGLSIATTIGSTSTVGSVPTYVGAGIDRDGRGGPLGGDDIDAKGPGLAVGDGTFDAPAVHSGRGRGDVANLLNDWEADFVSGVAAQWSADPGDTPIPNQDLVNSANPAALIPVGVPPGFDGEGDSSVDGGPGIPLPYADGGGNSLDGITLSVSDWHVGEMLSFNWFLLDNVGAPISTAGSTPANPFGFGVANIARVAPGSTRLPGAVFVGNSGLLTGQPTFFDSVNQVPNPALFGAEFGAGITGAFLDPNSNIFDAQVNTSLVPLPAGIWFMFAGFGTLAGIGRFRRRRI